MRPTLDESRTREPITSIHAVFLADEPKCFGAPSRRVHGMTKKQFYVMVQESLSEPYAFLSINMKVPDEERYIINLDTIINLDYYKSLGV